VKLFFNYYYGVVAVFAGGLMPAADRTLAIKLLMALVCKGLPYTKLRILPVYLPYVGAECLARLSS
jgi:hypothetical protein